MTKGFLKDLALYSPGKIIPGIIGFITIPIVTRLFSPQVYGNYSLVMVTILVLTNIAGWLPMSVVRFYPTYERDKQLNVFYGNIIHLLLLTLATLSLCFLLCLVIMKPKINMPLFNLMIVGIGVFIFSGIYEIFLDFLRSQRKAKWYSIFTVYKSAGSITIALIFILLLQRGIVSLLWGQVISILLILPIIARIALNGSTSLKFKIDFSFTKEMLKYSIPLAVGNLAAWILNLSDRYIIEFFRSSHEVGIYSASYNITYQSLVILTVLFTLASNPISIHLWEKEGKEKSADFICQITRYYLIICVPAAFGLSFLSEPLINIMTGEQYHNGYKIISFVAFGALFLGLQQRFQAAFIFYKKTIYITIAITVSGIVNIILNFILIPKYGYIAAGLTTLISFALLLALMIVFSRKFFIWKFPFSTLMKVTAASSIMGIVLYLIGKYMATTTIMNLTARICLGTMIFFGVLYFLKEFTLKEKTAVRQIITKYLPKKSLSK